jgi:hypothetical protein
MRGRRGGLEEAMKNILWGLALTMLWATPCQAGSYRAGQSHYYRQRVVRIYPLYQVASALREEAVATKAAQKALEAFLKELNTSQDQGTQKATSGCNCGSSKPENASTVAQPGEDSSVHPIFARCVSCHRPGHASGLDLTAPVMDKNTAAEIFLRAFSDDPAVRMPPDGSLTDEQRGQLLRWAEQLLKKQ